MRHRKETVSAMRVQLTVGMGLRSTLRQRRE